MRLMTAILTRNCRRSVDIVLRKHGLSFDAVVTREDSLPKPDPDGMLTAAWRMGVRPDACVLVGDYEFDIRSGRAAGAVTVLYSPDGRSFQTQPDFCIRSMRELPAIVRRLT
jgi:HAD superfamily hydrolase (TIGR01509 family)